MDDVAAGRRWPIAISSASSTSSVRRWLAIDQPTILRLQASRTTARYRKPLAVGTKVMSATQSWFGRTAVKLRSTRSGAGRASLSRRVVVTPCRRRLAPTRPGRAHQPGDALAAMPLPSCPKLGMDARRAIGLARGRVDGPDPLQQRRVGTRTGRWRTAPPGVIAGLRHAEHARHGRDRKHRLVRAHELEDPDGIAPVSRANQAAARERMSRSSRSCLFSRRSRASSSRSAAVSPRPFSSRRPSCRIGLRDPVADRLRGRLELAGEVVGIAAGADQIDHLATKLRRNRADGSWASEKPPAKAWGAPPNRVNFTGGGSFRPDQPVEIEDEYRLSLGLGVARLASRPHRR